MEKRQDTILWSMHRSKSEMPNEREKYNQREEQIRFKENSNDSEESDVDDEYEGTCTDLYRQMVIQLSEYLEVRHVHHLSYFWGITLPPDEREGPLFLTLMRKAEAKMIVTCYDFSRLQKGLSALKPCDVVDKAKSTVAVVKDQRDSGEVMPKNSRRPAKLWHWKKFCEWYENTKILKSEKSTGPYKATGRDIRQYLNSMYPHFRVDTIKKHFQSIEKYIKLSEKDKKEMKLLLKELGAKQTYLLQHLRTNWFKWSKPGQQDDEE